MPITCFAPERLTPALRIIVWVSVSLVAMKASRALVLSAARRVVMA
jgi:hypothetical protein